MDFHVSKRRSRKEFNILLERLKKLNIKNLHTDACKVYNKIPKKYKPTISKDQTTQVESFNSDLRHFLPFLHRKTKNYLKSKELLINRLNLFIYLYNKKIKNFFFFIKECCIFVLDMAVPSNNGFDWWFS